MEVQGFSYGNLDGAAFVVFGLSGVVIEGQVLSVGAADAVGRNQGFLVLGRWSGRKGVG